MTTLEIPPPTTVTTTSCRQTHHDARSNQSTQPADLSPLQILLAAARHAEVECDFCGRPMSDCLCDEDYSPWELRAGLPVFRTLMSAGCFECRELGCGGELACDCGCHDYDVEQERRREDLITLPVLRTSASAEMEVWELDDEDEDEYRRGQCVICSGDCESGYCVMFDDLVAASADCFECLEAWCAGECACICHDATTAAASACQIDHNRVTECDECGRCIACDECRCYDSNWWERADGAPTSAAAWELAA